MNEEARSGRMGEEALTPVAKHAETNKTVMLVGGGSIIAGREIMMLHLARALRRAGWRVVFITTLWSGKGEFIAQLDAERFGYYRVRLGFISKTLGWKPIIWTLDQLRYWPALALGYLRAVTRTAPRTVIHTNWHHALLLMPLLNNRRDLYWSHEVVLDKRHYRVIFKAIAKRVSRVVCVSNAVAHSIERLGVPPSKLIVIHNAVDLDAEISSPRAQLPLRLGIVGQIAPWKGHDDVIEAMAILMRRGIEIVLQVFGKGDEGYIRALQSRAVDLQLADKVHWHGFAKDHATIFQNVDVCLAPSRVEESFGMSVLEAAYFRRPAICSRRGGQAEIVEHGVTGVLVEPEQPTQLADAVEMFAKNPDWIVSMGAAARRRVEKEFSDTRFVERFVNVIEQCDAITPASRPS